MSTPPPANDLPSARRVLAAARRIVERVAESPIQDRVAAEAARLAFYFFLSFFPFILAIFAVTGLVGGASAFDWIMGSFAAALPRQTARFLEQFVAEVTGSTSPGALSVGLLLLLWSASNVFAALSDGLNAAYLVEQRHHWWKRRVLALALLAVASAAVVGGAVLLLAGPELADLVGLPHFESFFRWPLTFCLSVGLMWLIYYWLPNHDQTRSKRRILAGAMVGTTLWAIATVLFRLYVASVPRFRVVYGVVGGVVALLIWLYLTAVSILVGGEVAAALERRVENDRDAGEGGGRGAGKPSARPEVDSAAAQPGSSAASRS